MERALNIAEARRRQPSIYLSSAIATADADRAGTEYRHRSRRPVNPRVRSFLHEYRGRNKYRSRMDAPRFASKPEFDPLAFRL